MTTATELAPAAVPRVHARDIRSSEHSAGGPWVFLAAPISFALVLSCVIYLSRSF